MVYREDSAAYNALLIMSVCLYVNNDMLNEEGEKANCWV